MLLHVVIRSVHRHIGLVSHTEEREEFSRPQYVPDECFGLLFHWPRAWQWVDLKARAVARPPRCPAFEFRSVPREIQELVFNSLGRPLSAFSPEFLRDNRILAGLVRQGQPLELTFLLQTDHKDFATAGDQARQAGSPLALEFRAIALNKAMAEEGQVRLEIGPGNQPPIYGGFVALDLGNTNSALAALPVRKGDTTEDDVRNRSSQLVMLPDVNYESASQRALHGEAPSVASVVRVDRAVILSKVPEDARPRALDRIDAVEWRIGGSARLGTPPSAAVVVGPKRLVARPRDEKCMILAGDLMKPLGSTAPLRLELENWIPAELLICRLVQMFQAITRRRPEELAVTYPTSYSSSELQQLKLTVCRAWRRLHREGQKGVEHLDEAQLEKVIPLALDEATAAAFFFLYQEIFERAGSLHRFRYLYPDGFNLLLYDCGGGTTDIALVRAESPEHNRLELRVLGRSGVRDLGGDNVTEIIFKILKARLAFELKRYREQQTGEHQSSLEALPRVEKEADAKAWEGYFARNREAIDELVPTRFDPQNLDGNAQRRQQNAVALWLWAERVKYEMKSDAPVVKEKAQRDQLLDVFAGEDAEARDEIFKLMTSIRISQAEVNGLIRAAVEKSIRCCNSLVQDRLGREGREVDAVYVVGKASRYPLIHSLLCQQLQVPFLSGDHPRFHFEEAHLKNAVAKGAALALATLRAGVGVDLKVDKDLSRRLPFDVGYFDVAAGTVVKLYDEGLLYDELKERQIVIRNPASVPDGSPTAATAKWITMFQRWPGNDWEAFLEFHFEAGVVGTLTISYDPATHDFWADDGNDRVKAERKLSHAVYYSPVQRGDL